MDPAAAAPACLVGLDPQIGVTIVAIIGATATAVVAVMRGVQDLRRSGSPSATVQALPALRSDDG